MAKRRWIVNVDVEAEDEDEAIERFLHRLNSEEGDEFVSPVSTDFDDVEWGDNFTVEITRSCG